MKTILRVLLWALALVFAPALLAQTPAVDPDVAAARAAGDRIVTRMTAAEGAVAGHLQTQAALQAQVTALNAQLATLNAQLAAEKQKSAALQQQLSAAVAVTKQKAEAAAVAGIRGVQ